MKLLRDGETTCSCEGNRSPGGRERLCRCLADAARRRFGPAAPWVRRHIAHCPKCRQRLAALGKVDLALSVIKSQPHRLDLLAQANDAAIHMLNHRLREAAEAQQLKRVDREPDLSERWAGPQNALVNVAACLAVLVLAKAGIFTSLDRANARGQAAMKQYYTNHAGEDLADEIFRI